MKTTLPAFDPGCIALCSRGLVHSKTMEQVCRLIRRYPTWDIRFTHNEPIPQAQNTIVREILAVDKPLIEWILFIEEDNVPPFDAFEYFDAVHDVQTIDYPLRNGARAVRLSEYQDQQRVVFSGMGCLLVRADVFRTKIQSPWFRTGCCTTMPGEVLKETGGKTSYGGQDINFSYRLQEEKIPIHLIREVEADHLIVKEMGKPGTNDGCHIIEAL